MRRLSLLVLGGFVAACRSPNWEPACVASGDLHLCSTVAPIACNSMFAMSGLTVTFDGGTLDAYEATVVADDQTTTFECAGTQLGDRAGATVWMCSPEGFFVDTQGDHVEIAVTTADATYTTEADPCWDVSEPNGRCCGFHYSAAVELPL